MMKDVRVDSVKDLFDNLTEILREDFDYPKERSKILSLIVCLFN